MRTAQADRDGKHMQFAERYEGSELCCRNGLLLAQQQAESAATPEVLAELAIKRETANPFYWGVWTLLRVCPALVPQMCPSGLVFLRLLCRQPGGAGDQAQSRGPL